MTRTVTERQITEDDIASAKRIDIVQFLENNGYDVKAKGRTSVCSSPFSSDSDPSFVIYTDQNSFCDFSTGKTGDIISLAQSLLDIGFKEAVCMLNGTELPVWDEKEFKIQSTKGKPFNIDNYTTGYDHEIRAIDSYAKSRGITRNYRHGFFAKKISGQWLRFPSIMFPHEDINGKIIGAKFRNISHDSMTGVMGGRFSARGKLGFYICDDTLPIIKPDLYICESETSSNSLSEFMEHSNRAAVVISFGGVGTVPKTIPETYRNLDTKIIIDHDGNEKLYQERLKAYEHLNGTPIKLELPKGVDINSLWASGNLEMLDKLL